MAHSLHEWVMYVQIALLIFLLEAAGVIYTRYFDFNIRQENIYLLDLPQGTWRVSG